MVDETEFDIMDEDHESRLSDIESDECPMCVGSDIEFTDKGDLEKCICRDCTYEWVIE